MKILISLSVLLFNLQLFAGDLSLVCNIYQTDSEGNLIYENGNKVFEEGFYGSYEDKSSLFEYNYKNVQYIIDYANHLVTIYKITNFGSYKHIDKKTTAVDFEADDLYYVDFDIGFNIFCFVRD